MSSISISVRQRRPTSSTDTHCPPCPFRFDYEGVSEYLEDFVAWVNAPLLRVLRVMFSNQIVLNISQPFLISPSVRINIRYQIGTTASRIPNGLNSSTCFPPERAYTVTLLLYFLLRA